MLDRGAIGVVNINDVWSVLLSERDAEWRICTRPGRGGSFLGKNKKNRAERRDTRRAVAIAVEGEVVQPQEIFKPDYFRRKR